MTRVDDLSQKYDLHSWPHQFTKYGKEYQIGETAESKQFAVPMICVHCKIKYINGRDSRPLDPCPARTKRREMKRLIG